MRTGVQRGKLVKWNDDRGFGFIQPEDHSQEVFLHISDLDRAPRVGDIIRYQTMPGKNGKPRACLATIQSAIAPQLPQFKPVSPKLVLEVVPLALIPIIGSIHFTFTQANPTPLILYPAMSGLTFILYHQDKLRAQQRKWRFSENTLHLCEFCGGWLGAYVAQRHFRHKSSKPSYQFEFRVIVAVHLVGWLAWFFLKAK